MLEIAMHEAKNYDISNILSSLILDHEKIVVTQPTGEKFLMVALPFDLPKKQTSSNRPKFGSAKGKIIIADDFDEPLADFADYMPTQG